MEGVVTDHLALQHCKKSQSIVPGKVVARFFETQFIKIKINFQHQTDFLLLSFLFKRFPAKNRLFETKILKDIFSFERGLMYKRSNVQKV